MGRPEGLGAGGPVGASVEGAQPQREPCQPEQPSRLPRRPPRHTSLLTLKPPVLREGCFLWLLFADDP